MSDMTPTTSPSSDEFWARMGIEPPTPRQATATTAATPQEIETLRSPLQLPEATQVQVLEDRLASQQVLLENLLTRLAKVEGSQPGGPAVARVFGASVTPAVGGLFGRTPEAGDRLIGAPSNLPTPPDVGIPYRAGRYETEWRGQTSEKHYLSAITMMPEYAGFCFEELRYHDYQRGLQAQGAYKTDAAVSTQVATAAASIPAAASSGAAGSESMLELVVTGERVPDFAEDVLTLGQRIRLAHTQSLVKGVTERSVLTIGNARGGLRRRPWAPEDASPEESQWGMSQPGPPQINLTQAVGMDHQRCVLDVRARVIGRSSCGSHADVAACVAA